MLETRSAVYKMTKETARDERKVNNWPPPFLSDATPYTECDFGSSLRQGCSSKNLVLRISKVIVIGDVAVGKTSLVNRFCHKTFDNNYKATIGVDFEVERFDILGMPFHLQIWDTAGQERFKCIAASYYRNANVIMVVFDLANLMSLARSKQWLQEAGRSNAGPHHVFLVGTKRDLLSHTMYPVIERRAMEMARTMQAEYWAVSARSGNGVAELFTRVAVLSFHAMALREIHSRSQLEPIDIGTVAMKLNERAEKADAIARRTQRCIACQQ